MFGFTYYYEKDNKIYIKKFDLLEKAKRQHEEDKNNGAKVSEIYKSNFTFNKYN